MKSVVLSGILAVTLMLSNTTSLAQTSLKDAVANSERVAAAALAATSGTLLSAEDVTIDQSEPGKIRVLMKGGRNQPPSIARFTTSSAFSINAGKNLTFIPPRPGQMMAFSNIQAGRVGAPKLDAAISSIKPGEGISSMKRGASGSVAGTAGHLGLVFRNPERNFRVNVDANTEGGKLRASIEVVPADAKTEPRKLDLEFAEMKATSIEIGRDADGRVYVLNLTPGTDDTTPPEPKTLTADVSKLYTMAFKNSPVVMNDSEFLGSVGGSGMEYFFIDLPGRWRVEFSLVDMGGDTQVCGLLQDGQIRLENPDGSVRLDVYNVLSELAQAPIAGGPYKVWARWFTSSQSAEEANRNANEMLSKLTTMTMQFAPGAAVSQQAVDMAVERLRSGKPMMMYGGGGLTALPKEKMETLVK